MRHGYCVIDAKLPAAQQHHDFRYNDADESVQRTCRNQGRCRSLTKQIKVLVIVLSWEAGTALTRGQSGSDLNVLKSGFIGVGELLEGGLDISQLVPQCGILLTHTASLLCTSPQPSVTADCDMLSFGQFQALGG